MNNSQLCRGLFIEFAKPRKGSGKSYGQRPFAAGRARMPERGAGWALLGAHAEHAARMRFQRPWGIRSPYPPAAGAQKPGAAIAPGFQMHPMLGFRLLGYRPARRFLPQAAAAASAAPNVRSAAPGSHAPCASPVCGTSTPSGGAVGRVSSGVMMPLEPWPVITPHTTQR